MTAAVIVTLLVLMIGGLLAIGFLLQDIRDELIDISSALDGCAREYRG